MTDFHINARLGQQDMSDAEQAPGSKAPGSIGEVSRYFFRLGCLAFGGPAAHIAIMRRELVQQRKWLTDQEFVDHLGVTNLIPGPNSTEMTMYLSARRAGPVALWAGGAAFITPAVLIVLALAWAYVEYGQTPAGEALIYGIKPVILAVIIQASWGLRAATFKALDTVFLTLAVAGLALSGLPYTHEAILVIGGGLALLIWRRISGGAGSGRPRMPRFGRGMGFGAFLAVPPASFSLPELFWVFLKIGAVLYGSGYVLIAFIDTELVQNRGWLTEQQLVDAIAVGQFTPGPVFTTATFVGYLLDRVPGAAAATAGIFLPSFVFVALTNRLVPRLREWRWASAFLDGVNAGALSLMFVVCLQLAGEALGDPFAVTLFVAGAVWLIRYSPDTVWIILAGATAGIGHAIAT